METGFQIIRIQKQLPNEFLSIDDAVAVEAPLEIQVCHAHNAQPQSISVTMRTPGHDRELAVGFLFTEGLIQHAGQITSINSPEENITTVYLAEGFSMNLKKTERNFYTTSSCGVCGKSSIESIKTTAQFSITGTSSITSAVLFSLKSKIAQRQSLFSITGGIHAAALFDLNGNLEMIHEDVGRHNALDKLAGEAFLNKLLPLNNRILLLSGRASFELVQKAIMLGIENIVAVGAPSSLAVELALENQQTLVGFLKDDRFNVYSGTVQ